MNDRAEQAKTLIERWDAASKPKNGLHNAAGFARDHWTEIKAALAASEAEVTRLETGIAEALMTINGYRIWGHWRGENYDDGFNSGLEASSELLTTLSQPTTDTNGVHA